MISIIVPVYNCARYLRFCLDSILSQTYKDYEVILVNDGSKDGSDAICDEYAQQYPFVKVIHKKNGGVSSARNVGIKESCGEWLTFVDADDIISDYFLEIASSYTKNNEVSIILTGYNHIDEKNKRKYGRGYDNKIHLVEDYVENCFLQGACWAHFFKKQLLTDNNIFFDENLILSEDRLFVLENLICSRTIATLKNECYSYRDNTSSVTRTKITRKKVEARYQSIEAMLNLTRKYDLTKEQKHVISAFMPYMLNDYMYALCEINNKELTDEGQQKFRIYHHLMKNEGIQGFTDFILKGCVINLKITILYIKFKQSISRLLKY